MDNNTVPKVYILDGGFSTQLSCHVGDRVDGDPLWSARFLQTNPEDVINTHLDFLRAGSDIFMTNTYQASINGFVKYLDLTSDQAYALIGRAVDLAKRARNIYLAECENNPPDHIPLIAGSIGPYGAHLHDGSEYSGSYADSTSVETMKEWHKPRIQALVDGGVDILAFETIPCKKEALAVLEMLKEYPKMKAWLSFNCKDGSCLAHGENFQEVAVSCWESNPDQIIAVGVNCVSPLLVGELFCGINERREKPVPLITYPNSGENYNTELGWIDKDKRDALLALLPAWLDLGVRYVGGCCRTYGADIMKIKSVVRSWCDEKQFSKLKDIINE